jgi:hypothetical protein
MGEWGRPARMPADALACGPNVVPDPTEQLHTRMTSVDASRRRPPEFPPESSSSVLAVWSWTRLLISGSGVRVSGGPHLKSAELRRFSRWNPSLTTPIVIGVGAV